MSQLALQMKRKDFSVTSYFKISTTLKYPWRMKNAVAPIWVNMVIFYIYIFWRIYAFVYINYSKTKLSQNSLNMWRETHQMLDLLAKPSNTWKLAASCLNEEFCVMRRLQMIRALFWKTCLMGMPSLLVGLTTLGQKVLNLIRNLYSLSSFHISVKS